MPYRGWLAGNDGFVCARNAARDELALWSIARAGTLATRLCSAREVDPFAPAAEVGAGAERDRVLVVTAGERCLVYARRWFCAQPRLALTALADGRIAFEHRTIRAASIIARGPFVRFSDRRGTEVARFAIPWLAGADRAELAHRLRRHVALAR